VIETAMAIKRSPALDRIDVKILSSLQRNGRSTMQELATQVGLSPRASLERVRRLEAAGIIAEYRAVIDLAHLSRPVNIFAEITLAKQAHQVRVERRLAAIEEVVECWEVSGTVDYLAHFICADLAAYEALTSRLIDDSNLGLERIVSHVALRLIRRFAGYPESLLSHKPA
jgi:DNA-binding Lrp family transcriptional regulator